MMAGQAKQSILSAYKAGIKNLSIDFIYGLPGLSTEDWKKTLHESFYLSNKPYICFII